MSEPGSRRGRTHDAEGAREAILNAAEEVFAEHGFDGARVDAIAAASGYNKSLIFQYFGDKLGLYTEVIRHADDQTRDLQADAVNLIANDESVLEPAKFRVLFKNFMGELFDYFHDNPRVTRIFLWEMAEGWQTYLKVAPDIGFEDVETLRPLVQRFHDAGLLKYDFNPLSQIIVAEFMLMQYFATLPLYQLFIQDEDLSSAESLARAKEFLTEFIVNGLVPGPDKPKSSGD